MAQLFILLDTGGALLFIIPVFFIIHFITTLLIEGGILYSFQYNTFKKCLFHAFIANLSSLILGVFLLSPFQRMTTDIFGYVNKEANLLFILCLFYLLTILVEGFALRLLNKTFPIRKLIMATVLMNLITYATLYIILQFFK